MEDERWEMEEEEDERFFKARIIYRPRFLNRGFFCEHLLKKHFFELVQTYYFNKNTTI